MAYGIEFLHSDTRKFARMTPLQAFTHTEALVERIIGDANSMEEVKHTLSYLFIRNMATPHTLCHGQSRGTDTGRILEALRTCHTTYGHFVDTAHNTAQLFNGGGEQATLAG